MRIALLAALLIRSAGFARAVELTYWPSSNPQEIALAKKLVARWNAENPGVQVRMQPLPATQSSEEVLLSAIVSKTTPDVCSNILPAIMGRLVQAKAVVPVDRFPDGESHVLGRSGRDTTDSFRSRDGRLYQIPWKSNPVMLVYNTGRFKELGLKPPRTYSEFWKVARALTRDTDGDGRVDQWAMLVSIKTIWWQRLFDFYTFYVAASGGRTLLKDGRAAFANEAGAEVLAFFRKGFREGYFPMAGFTGDMFMEGHTAMQTAGPWIVKKYRELKPDLRFAFAPIPVPDGRAGPSYTYGDPKNIVIFSTARHPQEAWRFVKFLTSGEADIELLELTNQMPLRRGLVSDERFAPFFRKNPLLRDVARQIEHVSPMDESRHLVQILDIISSQYEAAAVYGIISPREALARAAGEVRRIHEYW